MARLISWVCPNVFEVRKSVYAIQFAIRDYPGLQKAIGDLDNFIYMFYSCFWPLIVDGLGQIYAYKCFICCGIQL